MITAPDNPASMVLADSEALYLPLHAGAVEAGGAEPLRDLAYGPDPRQRLDVLPVARHSGSGRPVFVFVHGGGFTSGERRRPGTPFHDNVLRWAATQRMVGINVGYRLAPAHPWPAAGEDVLRAMEAVVRQAPRWGGDPGRVFLLGHSAGASHVAEAMARALLPAGRLPWAATALLSGIYAPELAPPTAGRAAYYGADTDRWQACGALARLAPIRSPLCVLSSEREPEEFVSQATLLFEAVQRGGGNARHSVLQGHNHFSPILSLGSADERFAQVLKAFLPG